MIDIRQPITGDFEYIAGHMREMDKLECLAMGLSPLDGIMKSVSDSAENYVFAYNGTPLGAYGVMPILPLSSGKIVFWLLGTDGINQHKKDFMRQSREITGELLKTYSEISNSVYTEHKESIRWLTWLGAEFGESQLVNGLEFKEFVIRR